MGSINHRIVINAVCFVFLCSSTLVAQTRGVVIDSESLLPIPYVSIYSTSGDGVLGAMSNEHGLFEIDFAFQQLFFSHISYEKQAIALSDMHDTIYLRPIVNMLGEVVVSNKQPAWVNRSLKKIVHEKTKKYQTTQSTCAYSYNTYTLNDSNGYAFSSKGQLLVPKLGQNMAYKLATEHNVIYYKDSTAGVDFSNLRRMLYADFVTGFDAKFIREHQFRPNSFFEHPNPYVVQLTFTSNKFSDDDGYLIIDTLNHVILEVERNVGTDCNLKTQTSSFLRTVFYSKMGFTYDKWITKMHTVYQKQDASYRMTTCEYKFYMKTTRKHEYADAVYFTSIESSLIVDDFQGSPSKAFNVIPKPYYLLTIMTKEMRQEEEKLNNIPVLFKPFK